MLFRSCRITGLSGVRTFLGRPWRNYARTVFIRTEMSEVVRPAGWDNWSKPDAERTSFYAEFGSRGAGGDSARRVGWARSLTADDAAKLTPADVLAGTDGWNPVAR